MKGACPIVITHALISLESTEQRTVLMLLLSQVLRRDNLEILRPTPHPHVYLHFSLRQEKLVTLLGEIYFHFSLRHLQIPVRRWAMLLSAAYFSKCKVQSQMLRMAWTVKVRAPTSLSRQSPENSCTCIKFAIFFSSGDCRLIHTLTLQDTYDSLIPFPDPSSKRKGGSGKYSTSSHYGLAVAMDSAKS